VADGPGGSGGRSPFSGRGGLLEADGRPFRPAIPFDATIAVPDHLIWVLLVGSDARPGEDLLRSRADSIHIVGANPVTGQATVVGIPRDSWVPIPGHGVGKINSAMVFGGPDLLADTVHQLTGLPVQLYVVTGFVGMAAMVDAVGGVDVHVDMAIDDPASGAAFQAGWHHMDGSQALAFSRARKSLPAGDFDRSLHQGQVMLAALAKLRSEVGDAAGLQQWLQIGLAHVVLSNPVDTLVSLAAAARLTDVTQVRNVVAPGQAGWAGAQSVVYLDGRAFASLLDDLRPDAVIGPAGPPPTTTSTSTTSTPSTTATTKPPPTSTTAPTHGG
jgi:LCP family protein required for cell wall assembly